jgi:hypothetical protein
MIYKAPPSRENLEGPRSVLPQSKLELIAAYFKLPAKVAGQAPNLPTRQ